MNEWELFVAEPCHMNITGALSGKPVEVAERAGAVPGVFDGQEGMDSFILKEDPALAAPGSRFQVRIFSLFCNSPFWYPISALGHLHSFDLGLLMSTPPLTQVPNPLEGAGAPPAEAACCWPGFANRKQTPTPNPPTHPVVSIFPQGTRAEFKQVKTLHL